MGRAYKYMYYRLYEWNRRNFGDADVPAFNVLLGMSFIIFLNLVSIVALLDWLAGMKIVILLGSGRIATVVVAICVFLANYAFVKRAGGAKIIADEFAHARTINRDRGTLYIAVYIVLSFLMFFIIVTLPRGTALH